MATATSSVVCDNSSLANFQAWVAAIWNAFVTFGWAQTADTGQSANPPAAVPSSAYVYQIFKATDASATTTPIFVNVQCGFSATGVGIRITVGSGSDGAGNITGPIIGPHIITNNGSYANQGSGALACYFSGDAGSFRAMLWQTSSSVCTVFGIERSRGSSGSATTDYFTFLCVNATGSSGTIQQSALSGASVPTSQGFVINTSTGAVATEYYSATGKVAANPVIPLVGYPGNQMLGFVSASAPDVTESNGTPATVNVYGANHSYLFTQQGSINDVGLLVNFPVRGALGMLYE